MEVFLDAHDNYNYDELCVELNKKQKMKDVYLNDELLFFILTLYRKHYDKCIVLEMTKL